MERVKNNILINLKMEIRTFDLLDQIWKRRAPNNDEDPHEQSLKSWMWDQDLSKNMKWNLVFV